MSKSSLPSHTGDAPEFRNHLDLFEVMFQIEWRAPTTDKNHRGPSPQDPSYIPKVLQQEEQGGKSLCYQMGLLCRDLKLCNFTRLLPNNHNVHLFKNNYWRIQITNCLSHKVATAHTELGSWCTIKKQRQQERGLQTKQRQPVPPQ